MSLLQMKHICKSFSGVYANEDINLTVEKGEIHALLGRLQNIHAHLWGDARVVDQQINAAVFPFQVLHSVFPVVVARNIAPDVVGFQPGGL